VDIDADVVASLSLYGLFAGPLRFFVEAGRVIGPSQVRPDSRDRVTVADEA
jgi:hypothetical protein